MVIYVDVDDTLVRTFGKKRISIASVVEHVRRLWNEGTALYCWSSGGAEYANEVARELGIEECFVAYLPKPDALIDDQLIGEWRRFVQVHPGRCANMTLEDYCKMLAPE